MGGILFKEDVEKSFCFGLPSAIWIALVLGVVFWSFPSYDLEIYFLPADADADDDDDDDEPAPEFDKWRVTDKWTKVHGKCKLFVILYQKQTDLAKALATVYGSQLLSVSGLCRFVSGLCRVCVGFVSGLCRVCAGFVPGLCVAFVLIGFDRRLVDARLCWLCWLCWLCRLRLVVSNVSDVLPVSVMCCFSRESLEFAVSVIFPFFVLVLFCMF